jgi:acetyl-CoA carboxylase biotin carboxylase subunit
MLKAVAGGGGRGMRAVRDIDELNRAFPIAQAEAQLNFGNGGVYLERMIERGRHVEIQIAADRYGNTVHLGERECSMQRRHQKMLEESPAPRLSAEGRLAMGRIACQAVASIGYQNVGTLEFLVDQLGEFYFLEMNTRLQVEHPVTELVTGIDLVKLQIALAAGERMPFKQSAITWRGCALEARVTAEDPERGFAPDAGHIDMAHFPGGPWVRIDTHVFSGYTTPSFYDSLLAKIVVWGQDRAEAIARLRRAVDETQIQGIKTNLDYLALVLSDPRFQAGDIDVEFVERHLAEHQAAGDQVIAAAGAAP